MTMPSSRCWRGLMRCWLSDRRAETSRIAFELYSNDAMEAGMRAFLAALSCAFLAALLFEPTSWAHSLAYTYLVSDPDVPAEGRISNINRDYVPIARGYGRYVCDFTYTYRVQGVEFTGRIYSFDGRPRCHDVAGKFAIGQTVTVFHDRDDPGFAVMDRVEGIPRSFVPISVIWGAFVIYLVIHVYRYVAKRRAFSRRIYGRSKR